MQNGSRSDAFPANLPPVPFPRHTAASLPDKAIQDATSTTNTAASATSSASPSAAGSSVKITRRPYLDRTGHTSGHADRTSAEEGPTRDVEDDKGEVCGGPADRLECEKSDEGGGDVVVYPPADVEACCEGVALVCCQNGLSFKMLEVGSWLQYLADR